MITPSSFSYTISSIHPSIPPSLVIYKKTQNLNPEIFATVMDHYAEGGVIVSDHAVISDTTILDTDDEVVAMIKELMESRIRPAVQEDGGDIFYEGFDVETGVVSVRLAGSCSGCPSSAVTLKNGVENMLMHYIPEVREGGREGGRKGWRRQGVLFASIYYRSHSHF